MIVIREVIAKDNPSLADLIRKTLMELGVPKVGTAFEDPELDNMSAAYDYPRAAYFVIEEEGVVIGGAGIAPLAGEDKRFCELQKMYFLPQARGKGLGKKMIKRCLSFAKANKFNLCYIETLPTMEAAQKLYVKTGFTYLDAPMGNTGHTSCNVWLKKEL